MGHLLCCSTDWEQVQRAFGLWGCAVRVDGEVTFSLSFLFPLSLSFFFSFGFVLLFGLVWFWIYFTFYQILFPLCFVR